MTNVELSWSPDNLTRVCVSGDSATEVIKEAEKMMKFTAPKKVENKQNKSAT